MGSPKRKWFWLCRGTARAGLAALLVGVGLVPATLGQQGKQPGRQDIRQEYEAALAEWKATYIEIATVYKQFGICEEHEAGKLQEQYRALKKRGDELAGKTIDLAADVYIESENADAVIEALLKELPERYYAAANYAKSARVGMALLRHEPGNHELMFNTIRSAFFSNNFTLAGGLTEKWKQDIGKLPREMLYIDEVVKPLQTAWERELELRRQDEADHDLPRIEFDTDQGNITVELFEHQAPIVVNNLVNLVENTDFMQNMDFYSVLEHQFATVGCRKGDGTAVVKIAETTPENLRDMRGHFRGAFSLTINQADGAILTSGRFLRTPIPDMDGHSMVVGRVIEGMDVVDRIANTHKLDDSGVREPIMSAKPDRLIGMRVARKPEGKIYKHIEQTENQKSGDNQ